MKSSAHVHICQTNVKFKKKINYYGFDIICNAMCNVNFGTSIEIAPFWYNERFCMALKKGKFPSRKIVNSTNKFKSMLIR